MKLAVAILFLSLLSCSPQRMMETNLYFGQSKPSGGMITETEWKSIQRKLYQQGF